MTPERLIEVATGINQTVFAEDSPPEIAYHGHNRLNGQQFLLCIGKLASDGANGIAAYSANSDKGDPTTYTHSVAAFNPNNARTLSLLLGGSELRVHWDATGRRIEFATTLPLRRKTLHLNR
ncbi:MAG TPA: hypothetical protein VJ836_04340 [Candidatus Saccharimonadales bacterium]|nr:hypothetical protein [Candidatus Saccharimonadales bacterium]